jgi:hypothetical protein
VVIISHGLWQRRFGSDPNLVGKTIALDGQNRTVVGILPAGFQFPHKSFPFAEPADLFVPLAFTSEQIAQGSGRFEYKVLARLRHGVTLDQAQGQADEDHLASQPRWNIQLPVRQFLWFYSEYQQVATLRRSAITTVPRRARGWGDQMD